jgi:uncharacterized cupin superfamily protein
MPKIDTAGAPQGSGSRYPAPFVVLVTDAGEEPMRSGESAGFKAGVGDGHHFQNRSSSDAVILVVGTRSDEDHGEYSDIDMAFGAGRYSAKGSYHHKDGTPY